jgi:hypothetical protein
VTDLRPTISPHLTADEVLYVLAGRETVQLGNLSLSVVTGDHAPAPNEPDWPYTAGEIIVTQYIHPEGFRELISRRSIEAWHTSVFYRTEDLQEAVALSSLVAAGAERGMYQWDGSVWYRSADQQEAHERWCSVGDEYAAFVGDTNAANTYGMDISYPDKYPPVEKEPRHG